jgi:hypothetical protein
MTRRRAVDPDAKSPTPFCVIYGEWWNDRREELSHMTRKQLEAALDELDLPIPGPEFQPHIRMLWMRLRLAYAEQIEFHRERNVVPPANMLARAASFDRYPGRLPAYQPNIFWDVAGEGPAKAALTKQNNAIEAAILRESEEG